MSADDSPHVVKLHMVQRIGDEFLNDPKLPLKRRVPAGV